MSLRIVPNVILSAAVAISLALAALAIVIATTQPWLGLDLTGWDEGDLVWVTEVDTDGPAQGVPSAATLVAIAAGGGSPIELVPQDLLEEPDTLTTYAAMRAFFERQDSIARAIAAEGVMLTTDHLSTTAETFVRPASGRPLTDLPVAFWIQIGVGLAGFWSGAWVMALRSGDWATRALALAGAGLLVSAFPAAIYSTRELALPGDLFYVLSALNFAGALTFGAGMITLFLIYPRRLVPVHWIALPTLILGGWVVLEQTGFWSSPATGRHLAILLAMLTIVVLVALQFRATRGDPRDRAALTWLGLAVVIGAGAFVATVIAPVVFGFAQLVSQGEAFLFFLLIYAGVALGVARFQLFRLDDWAFRILFYLAGGVALLVIDAALILTIIDERVPAFALSLLIVATVWLPLRDVLARRALRRREPERAILFRQVLDVALAPIGPAQEDHWRALLDETFHPLAIVRTTARGDTTLRDDGLGLIVPGPGGLPDLRLDYAARGRRLFSPRDADLAEQLTAMLAIALDSRAAHEKGAAEERMRIARDIHDNIGVQLMGALHSKDADRKDMMIRETLGDLRDIINNAAHSDLSFAEMLADLRAQTAEHLHGAGVTLTWDVAEDGPTHLPLPVMHALRSMIREAVQNALRHARPTAIAVTLRCADDMLTLGVTDDGGGFDPSSVAPGHGLANMHARVTGLGGRFDITGHDGQTRIVATIPLGHRRVAP